MRITDLLADTETVPEAAPDPGVETPETPAAADPGADSDVPAASAGAVETPGTPFDPSELQTRLDAAEARSAQLEAFLAQAFAGTSDGGETDGQPQLDLSGLDPFADDFGQQLITLQQQNNQQLLQQIAGMFQQFAEPFNQQREQEIVAHGESNLDGILDDIVARDGEFHGNPAADQRARTMVRERANQLYPDLAQRFGGHEFVVQAGLGPRVAEQAMTAAAAEVRDLFKLIGTSAVEVEANRVATLAGASGEPGTTVGAVQGQGVFQDGKSVVDFYAGKARSLNAA